MLEAALWGFVGGIALVLGAIYALVGAPSQRVVGLIMAFGSGVLISAVAYELVAQAFIESGGNGVLAAGLAIGALTYFGGDSLIARRSTGADNSGLSIALGAVLDGIPESIVIGISILGGEGVSVAMVVAVFVSNLPESIAATDGLRKSGVASGRILGMWIALSFVFGVASALGFVVVGGQPVAVQAFVQAFAAGALLTMLGNTMIPEAYERARRWAGLCLVLGFALAFGLVALEAVA